MTSQQAASRRRHRDTFYNNSSPSAPSSSSVVGAARIMESCHHLSSLDEYLHGLIGNTGCKELVLIYDDPRSSRRHSAPPVVMNTATWRFRSRSQEEQGGRRNKEDEARTLTSSCSRTQASSCIDDLFVDGNGNGNGNGDGEGDEIWNHACPLGSRKKLGPAPPPLILTSGATTSSTVASPPSVLFHPNNAPRCRQFLCRIGRAATIPTPRFDLRRDLRNDCYHNSFPISDLKTDAPPSPPQRRPSLRNLDCQT